jgi:hypothetical protein
MSTEISLPYLTAYPHGFSTLNYQRSFERQKGLGMNMLKKADHKIMLIV